MKPLTPILVLLLICSCASKGPPKKSVTEKKAEIFYQSGTQKLVQKNYRGALKDLQESYKLIPNDTKTLNNLGMAYYLMGDLDRGLHFINKSLTEDPKNSEARTNLASLYITQGKDEVAEKQLKLVLEDLVFPHQYRTHYNLALIKSRRKDFQGAITHLISAISMENNYCPAYYELGLIHRQEGRLENSLKYFKDGIKGTCYGQPASHYQLGKTLMLIGQTKEAIEKFNFIKEEFQDSPYYQLAESEISRLRQKKYEEFRRNKLPNKKKRKSIYNSRKESVSSPKF